MIARLAEFWSFADPNVRWVAMGAVLLGVTCAVVGCFSFLQKRSLAGDALAHASLPGVTTAFMLTGSRDPLVILGGAVLSCLLAYLCIDFLIRQTKVREDSALAMVLSLFFAAGIFQLTMLQSSGAAGQAGLDKLLFGQAASLTVADVRILTALAAGLLVIVVLFFHRFRLVAFDRGFAASVGIAPNRYDLLLALILVSTIALGLQLVGVVLLAALLLTPASAARYWSSSLHVMMLLAAIFGAIAGLLGANISYTAPQMPTGPWIVVAISTLFLVSCLAAPHRGIIARVLRDRAFSRRVTDENILRTLYKLGENRSSDSSTYRPVEILEFRHLSIGALKRGIARLVARRWVTDGTNGIALTRDGLEQARAITRRHRLWELYLASRIDIPPDHVHADAEEIEHILTPELEAKLMKELASPYHDPHGSKIPERS